MVLNITKKSSMEDEHTPEVRKERRNGMGNIFDGIDPSTLQRLGWTVEVLDEVEKIARRNITEGTHTGHSDSADSGEDSDTSLDLTLVEGLHDILPNSSRRPPFPDFDISQSISNRKRRNGLADLFEALSVNQKQLFVKLIQATPTRQTCVSH